MTKTFQFSLLIFIFIFSCSDKQPNKAQQQAKEYAEAYEIDERIYEQVTRTFSSISEPKPIANDPRISEKVKLGKILYYDTRLSKEGNISCNSCHDLSTFGVDNLPTSPGDAGEHGDRNSPTVLNAALHTSQFWDGRAKDVEEQAGMPILNPAEMAIPSEEFLIDRLNGIELYQSLFSSAFPNSSDAISYENLKTAIGAFERTLITPSAFDEYLNGKKGALTLQQKKGLSTFIEVGCITCHTGPMVGGNLFQKFGVHYDYWEFTQSDNIDEGKFKITGNEADRYVFKVPTLRNVTKTAPYFHDGSVDNLFEAIKIMARVNLNKDLQPSEIENIISFMESLEGMPKSDWATFPEELAQSQG